MNSSTTSHEVLSSGVDWITATTKPEEQHYNEWYVRGQELVHSFVKRGDVVRPKYKQGYGGFGAGSAFFGQREDSAMLELTSSDARQYFNVVYRDGLHFTRLDLQVTVRYTPFDATLAHQVLDDAEKANESLPEQRQRKLHIASDRKGGDTAYIGAPSSPQRGRVYNKYAESKEECWKDCWRWEVQLRNDFATKAAFYIGDVPTYTDVRIMAFVYSWYEKRGCKPPWVPGEIVSTIVDVQTDKTDLAKSEQWLYNQVRPTVTRLRQAGYEKAALRALGFANDEDTTYEHGSGI